MKERFSLAPLKLQKMVSIILMKLVIHTESGPLLSLFKDNGGREDRGTDAG